MCVNELGVLHIYGEVLCSIMNDLSACVGSDDAINVCCMQQRIRPTVVGVNMTPTKPGDIKQRMEFEMAF